MATARTSPSFENIDLLPPPVLQEGKEEQFIKLVSKYLQHVNQWSQELDLAVREGWLVNNARVVSLDAEKITSSTIFTQDLFVGSEKKIQIKGTTNTVEIFDAQTTPKLRTKIGKLGTGASNYGQQWFDPAGTLIMQVGDTVFIDGGIINNASITNAKIVDVDFAKINNVLIQTAQIANSAVTNAKIANLAVDGAKITNAAITNAKIANLAVTNLKIGGLAVTTPKLSDRSVDEVKRIIPFQQTSTQAVGTLANNTGKTIVMTVTHNFGFLPMVTPGLTSNPQINDGLIITATSENINTLSFRVAVRIMNHSGISINLGNQTIIAQYR